MARRRYDDKFRASAVVMLEAAGYPQKKGALMRVAKRLNIPHQTLSRWANGHNNPPPPDLVLEKSSDLVRYIYQELGFIFSEAHKARPDAAYKDLLIGVGILVDKLQLLTGEPTARTESVYRQLEGLNEHEYAAVVAEAERIVAEATGGGADSGDRETAGGGDPVEASGEAEAGL